MAFFGLTALGPQSTFKSSLRDFSYLDVFTPVDRERAFSVVDTDDRGYLNKEQVRGRGNDSCGCCVFAIRRYAQRGRALGSHSKTRYNNFICLDIIVVSPLVACLAFRYIDPSSDGNETRHKNTSSVLRSSFLR